MAFNLFGNAVPATVNANDGPLALGTVVQISQPGAITKGRWRFPTSLPSGPVTWYCADLSTHTLLASQVFVSPVAGQWNETPTLASPVIITGAKNVLVWVGTPGGYVFTNGLFTAAPTVSGPLTAPRSINDPEGVGNGRFGGTPSSYPGGTSGATSYFADLVFELAPPSEGSATLGLDLLLYGVGESPVVPPPPEPTDPIGTPVAQQLLACLTEQLDTLPERGETTGAYRPGLIQLRVGQDVAPLIGPNVDECCTGLAWVRIANIYPSWDSFPAADNTWTPCGPLAYAVVLEMGVSFCMPWSDSDESMDNIDPPSEADWATAFTTQMVHQTLMRRAAACCFLPTQRRAVGEWTAMPVEAGCTGGKMTVTVSVMAPCGDC